MPCAGPQMGGRKSAPTLRRGMPSRNFSSRAICWSVNSATDVSFVLVIAAYYSEAVACRRRRGPSGFP